MSRQDLLLWVFCLTDAEVIAVELVGESWGLDTDKGIYRHFRDYHRAEFPALAGSTGRRSPARPPTRGPSSG